MPANPLHIDVAIVGAGFSGTMVAVQVLKQAIQPISVALIERSGQFAKGIAYGTNDPAHLLNVPAGRMGAFPEDIDSFYQWIAAHPTLLAEYSIKDLTPGDFLPRVLYGKYLEDLLASAGRDSLVRIPHEAVDIVQQRNGTFVIECDHGIYLAAKKVVLALGNFPPGDPILRDRRFHTSPFYLNTPWREETRNLLSQPGDILILGSGLTGLDLLLSLDHTKTEGRIHVLSRRGLFPQPHRSVPAYAGFLQPDQLPKTALQALRLIRKEIESASEHGIDWRAVIDSIRPMNQAIWQQWDTEQRSRFIRHLRAYWESHRHRAAPEALSVKDHLESAGVLTCHRGRVSRIEQQADFLHVRYREHRTLVERELNVRYVVNCTGPECNYHKLKDPLIFQLFFRGLISPDPLFLGLDVGTGGIVHNVYGDRVENLFTLGSPQKGRLFETTAVPELRSQAAELTRRILRDQQRDPAESSRAKRDPVYEI